MVIIKKEHVYLFEMTVNFFGTLAVKMSILQLRMKNLPL